MSDDTTQSRPDAQPVPGGAAEAAPEAPLPPEIPTPELRRRVIYSLLRPAARLARVFRMPLKELTDWVEMAYFQELREHELKLREVADLMRVSMRKAAQLSARLKDNFFDPERQHGLPRRLEFMLWAGPLSRARLSQVLVDEEPDDVARALEELERQGRVALIDEKRELYAVTRSQYRLYRDNWMARIDGLNHLVGTVAHAAFGRFFADEPLSFARTLSLRVRPADRERLRELYENVIWPTLRDLDEAAKGDAQAATVDVSVCWAPYEYLASDGSDAEGEGDD